MAFSREKKHRETVVRLIIYFASLRVLFPRFLSSLWSRLRARYFSRFPYFFVGYTFPFISSLLSFVIFHSSSLFRISPPPFFHYLATLISLLCSRSAHSFTYSSSYSHSLSLRSVCADDTMNYLWIASRNKSNRSRSRDQGAFSMLDTYPCLLISSRVTHRKEKWLIYVAMIPRNAERRSKCPLIEIRSNFSPFIFFLSSPFRNVLWRTTVFF